MAVWQEQAGMISGDRGMSASEASRISVLAGLWMLACLGGGLAELVWRSHQIAGWAAATAGPSFWYAHHRPSLVILGVALAICLLVRVAFKDLRLRLALMCATALVGATAAVTADRSYYGVVASQVIVRPSAPWRPDVRVPLSAVTPVLRRCYQYVHRGSIDNDVQFVVRYDGPQGPAYLDLGQGLTPSSAGRWLAAMSGLQYASGGVGQTTASFGPTSGGGGNEPACMARYLSRLGADQRAEFERLLE